MQLPKIGDLKCMANRFDVRTCKVIEIIFFKQIYELILMKNPSVFNKITIINSDLTKDNILSEEDRQKLIEEVDVVFHCAATVRFNEKLKQSVKINIKATKYFIDMAREMNNLKART